MKYFYAVLILMACVFIPLGYWQSCDPEYIAKQEEKRRERESRRLTEEHIEEIQRLQVEQDLEDVRAGKRIARDYNAPHQGGSVAGDVAAGVMIGNMASKMINP